MAFSKPIFLHGTLVFDEWQDSRQRWVNRIPTPNRHAESPPETQTKEGFFLSTASSLQREGHFTYALFAVCFAESSESQVYLLVSTHTNQKKSTIHGSKNIAVSSHWPKASYRTFLVGCWTNPFKKYDRQIGSFPHIRVNMKKGLKQSPSFFLACQLFGSQGFLLHPTLDLRLERMWMEDLWSKHIRTQMVVKNGDESPWYNLNKPKI